MVLTQVIRAPDFMAEWCHWLCSGEDQLGLLYSLLKCCLDTNPPSVLARLSGQEGPGATLRSEAKLSSPACAEWEGHLQAGPLVFLIRLSGQEGPGALSNSWWGLLISSLPGPSRETDSNPS